MANKQQIKEQIFETATACLRSFEATFDWQEVKDNYRIAGLEKNSTMSVYRIVYSEESPYIAIDVPKNKKNKMRQFVIDKKHRLNTYADLNEVEGLVRAADRFREWAKSYQTNQS